MARYSQFYDSDDDDIFDKKTLVSKSTLAPLLRCKLCGKPFRNATVVEDCGHTFCRGCIEPHISEDRACPICKARVSGLDRLQQDMMLQGLTDKFLESSKTSLSNAQVAAIRRENGAGKGAAPGGVHMEPELGLPGKGSSASAPPAPKPVLVWSPSVAKPSDPLPYNVLPPGSQDLDEAVRILLLPTRLRPGEPEIEWPSYQSASGDPSQEPDGFSSARRVGSSVASLQMGRSSAAPGFRWPSCGPRGRPDRWIVVPVFMKVRQLKRYVATKTGIEEASIRLHAGGRTLQGDEHTLHFIAKVATSDLKNRIVQAGEQNPSPAATQADLLASTSGSIPDKYIVMHSA